jgi:glutamyl-tRNA synthetase
MTVRTRFAPSPTGYLHIGGVRTALFSWLYARRMDGQFILRIEDTDRERSTEESVNVILEGMEWLGLFEDEGPYYQTARFDRYREVIQQLVDDGHAYYCDCSRDRLDALREEQMANRQKPRYDGCCRDKGLAPSAETVVRFRNPVDGDVVIDDQVKGRIVISNTELDDLIIERSDGTPTYNLTVVVDDWDMRISHVIRGDDHVNNTPRQINILKALGADLPVYAHLPMILGADGKRLSKRHGAVNVLQYRDEGYLPEAMLNYLVRLGWSHGDQEIFSIDEMIGLFDLVAINRSPSTFNPEKLSWLNQQYIMKMPLEDLTAHLDQRLAAAGVDTREGPELRQVAALIQDRCVTLDDLVRESRYFYADFGEYDEKAAKKHLKPAALEALQALHRHLAALEEWNTAALHTTIDLVAKELDLGMGRVGMPLRLAATGGGSSPSIDAVVELLGRETTLERLQHAIEYVEKRKAA